MDDLVLTLNGGSSSLKFAGYELASGNALFHGAYEGLGKTNVQLKATVAGQQPISLSLEASTHEAATLHLFNWLRSQGAGEIRAIGHRVVNGGPDNHAPLVLDADAIAKLRAMSAFAPAHLPAEIAVMECCREHFPDVLQVACFDTAFHRTMPAVARRLPIPRRFGEMGAQRFGYHGLSYASLLSQFRRQAGASAASGRLVMAHLGNGSSLAAVWNGASIDTTMGFSTSGGIPMATRSGDLDPGLAYFLERTADMNGEAFHTMVNSQAGLLGVSGTTGDIRELLALEAQDSRAAEALDLFCYRVRQAIGAMTASLGGIDTLIFSGGIGANAPEIRRRICAPLGYLGITLDPATNGANSQIISLPSGTTGVRVITTDEESVIFEGVRDMLASHRTSTRTEADG